MADFLKRERGDPQPGDDLLGSFHESPSDAQRARAAIEDESASGKRWTQEQDEALRRAVDEFGQRNWKSIASRVPGRNHAQCLQRWNKVLKPGLVKGHWSYEEDSILERMVLKGSHSWAEVADQIQGRTAKQCRERWRNHLDPSISKAPFSAEEDFAILQAFESMGNRWTQIAELLPGRTEDAIKLRWKSLNPNQRTNAKPGRPRLMPGMTVNKARSNAPPNPDDVAATLMASPPPPPISELSDYPHHSYADASPHHMAQASPAPMAVPPSLAPVGISPAPMPEPTSLPPYHSQTPRLELPEPSVEPLDDDGKDVDSNDAAILKELLRSHSNSLMSFGSIRGMGSFADMSPEDLLASGELDEMLRAVSIANAAGGSVDDGASGAANANGLASFKSFRGSRGATSSFTNVDSFSKSTRSSGKQDHLFQNLIDDLRAGGGSFEDANDSRQQEQIEQLPVDHSMFASFSSSSGRNLMHSLEFPDRQSNPLPLAAEAGRGRISPAVGAATSGIDDLFDPDLMRPIRKGVKY